jgi:F-type H+-transporting ATPase subunit alpha
MSTLQAEEISSLIKSKLTQYEAQTSISDVGTVMEVGDGIARIYGLRNAMAGELLQFEDGHNTMGMVLNLEEDNVGAVIMGEYIHIQEGQLVKTTGRIASVPLAALLTRWVSPSTAKAPSTAKNSFRLRKKPPVS